MTQSPPGSKSSKSSKDKKRSGKEKSRRASRSINDVESPEDTEKMRMLAGGPGKREVPQWDTRALAEQVDDGGGQVHSSMAKVKVVSLRE